jgi:hypothetical protein
MESIVYSNSDKGLGIAAVDLKRYIECGLKHVKDGETYGIIPEEQVWNNIRQLKREIFSCTAENKSSLADEVVECIRNKLEENLKDPFSHF